MPDHDRVVFVIDDDQDVRNGLKALLDSLGLSNQTFASTRDFLRLDLPDRPSCLVLDVRLPGASGLDFQRELSQANIRIPIIFISGHGDVPMTVKVMKAGAFGFFTKPLHEQDLLDAIHGALESDKERRDRDRQLQDLRRCYESLSPREQQVMERVTAGLLNKQTAAEIGLSEVTIKVHRHNVMKKMRAKSLPELVRIADILGIKSTKTRSG